MGRGWGTQAAENKRRVRNTEGERACACACACVRVRVSLSVSLHTDSDSWIRRYVTCVPALWVAGGGWERETGEGKEGGRGPPPARPLAGSTPSVRLGGGRGVLQEQSLTRAGWGTEWREGEEQVGGTGRGRGRGRAGRRQYLSDAEGDVAHIEAPGLSGHLATDHGHRCRGHSQTVGGHGGEKGGGWNLTGSFKRKRRGLEDIRAPVERLSSRALPDMGNHRLCETRSVDSFIPAVNCNSKGCCQGASKGRGQKTQGENPIRHPPKTEALLPDHPSIQPLQLTRG